MNFGPGESLVWNIFMYGDVQLIQGLIDQMKWNWTPEQWEITLLDILKDLGATNITISN